MMVDTGADDGPADVAEATTTPSSLEDKMASWEASEEEARSKTLGGNLPLIGMPGLPGRVTRTDQPTKMDGFDVFMNLSGIILFPLAILLFAAPFMMGNIDVSSSAPRFTAVRPQLAVVLITGYMQAQRRVELSRVHMDHVTGAPPPAAISTGGGA
eukprot:65938-Prymnesium_polylepis.1